MFWYVLFVQTGCEHRVEEYLRKRLNSKLFTPFVPLEEKLFKMASIVKKEILPLFPGYVFIESELTSQEFIELTRDIIYSSKAILTLLKYSETEIAMREAEKQFLLNLCNEEHCIESSTGIIEGNRICILDGPLKGLESIVKKVNRHKRCAEIELVMMGEVRKICLSLEIVSKIL